MSHHENRAGYAISDTLDLNRAVVRAQMMTSSEDTLLVVAADHSNPLVIQGYPRKGRDILGERWLGGGERGIGGGGETKREKGREGEREGGKSGRERERG